MPYRIPNYWTVYRLTCEASGKQYIGITHRHVNERWLGHCGNARHHRKGHQSALGSAIRKYGASNFIVNVLYYALNGDEAAVIEQTFIAEYCTLSPAGYNLTGGGEYQKKLSAETHARLKAAARARSERMAAFHRGRKRSAETRAKISAKAKGRIGTPRKKNPVGVAGVWFDKSRQQWRSQITSDGIAKNLGRFNTAAEAIDARRAAERARLCEWGVIAKGRAAA